MQEIEMKLKRPFEARQISWRVGATNGDKTKGIALAYIDARDVMQRLDDVMGLNWQCRYSHAQNKTICDLGLKLDGEWIWRAGGAGDTDIEAEKGAISDAFKRAAVLFGIGRYLYSLPNKWVALEDRKIKEVPALPSWATPEGFDALMKKRAAAGGVISAGTGLWEELPTDMQIHLMDVIGEIRAFLKNGKVEQASKHIASLNIGTDEMAALYTRLDSKERRALDDFSQRKAA